MSELLSFWWYIHHKIRVVDKTRALNGTTWTILHSRNILENMQHAPALCSSERFMVFDPNRSFVIQMSKVWSIYHHRTKKPVCRTVSSLTKTRDQSSQYLTTGHWLTREWCFRMLCMREVERVLECSQPLSAPSEQMTKYDMKGRWVTQKPMQNLSSWALGLIRAPPKSGKMLSSCGTSSPLNYSRQGRA